MSSRNTPTADRRDLDGAAVGKPADGSSSRPSKNNRQDPAQPPEPVEPGDLPNDNGLRPVSVEPNRVLRDEAVIEVSDGPQARPWYSVIEEWRDWYHGYLGSHIEFENSEGETVRTALENSYMPEYGKRYYAKLKDFERGVEREFDGMTTVMLTFTASHRNANGGWRCPADHMRDIMDGYDAARKQVHQALSGRRWEYARVMEPHADGYGHLHMAIFVEDDADRPDLEREQFEAVMESHVRNCGPAGRAAHRVTGEDAAVSINEDVNNLGSYISEYIGIFGEQALDRPMNEQAFYATCWATNTRRVDFSNGAHDVMNREQTRREYRRDTDGLEPEDSEQAFEEWKDEGDDGPVTEWVVESICSVSHRKPEYADPTTGGVDTTVIEGRPGVDPPPDVT